MEQTVIEGVLIREHADILFGASSAYLAGMRNSHSRLSEMDSEVLINSGFRNIIHTFSLCAPAPVTTSGF
jgi:hypothetical protein